MGNSDVTPLGKGCRPLGYYQLNAHESKAEHGQNLEIQAVNASPQENRNSAGRASVAVSPIADAN